MPLFACNIENPDIPRVVMVHSPLDRFALRWLARGIVLLFIGIAPAHAANVTTYFVIDATNGNVLARSNPDKEMYPASLTKMMTLYMLFEALENGTITPGSELTFSKKATEQVPSKLGIKEGRSISVEDAIQALLTKSANDVAVTVAEGLGGGSEWRFTVMMTEKALELGMRNTRFTNASGLHRRDMWSTARDMAILALRLQFDFPAYYHLFSTRQFSYNGVTHRNHNKLLGKVEGVDGLKTGYTKRAGWNIATSAAIDGRRIVGVVMGGKDRHVRDSLMTKLLANGFATADGLDREVPVPSTHPGRAGESNLYAALDEGLGDDDFIASLTESLGIDPQSSGPDQGSAADGQTWAIQVGAYAHRDNALRASADAGKHLAGLLAGNESTVMASVELGGTTLFRVRVLYLTENQARTGCRILNERDLPCSVLDNGES